MEEILKQILVKIDDLKTETNNNFDKVNERLDSHAEELKKINARLDEHEEKINQMNEMMISEFEEISINFKMIFAKLAEHDKQFERIEEQFKEVNAKLAEHDKQFAKIDKQFKEVNAKLTEYDKQFNEVNSKLSDHDLEFTEIKNYLLVLEDNLSTKLPALFDGYSANKEKTDEIEERQECMEGQLKLNSLRISVLEESSKTYSEQLSKLKEK